MVNQKPTVQKKTFLQQYKITTADFERTGLDWGCLESIFAHHVAARTELQATADDISQRLRQLSAVHSLKVRVKHPEHVLEKIIRKCLAGTVFDDLGPDSYRRHITDLIGIRALHLFKDDWAQIHHFVRETWDLNEDPIAYVREGDAAAVVDAFKAQGCAVQEHQYGYRSVHYLLKSQPTKTLHVTELQVRTLFEEGWSEIDHQVRYPRLSNDPILHECLRIFNRQAGSADEMGTFIKALDRHHTEQSAKIAQMELERASTEAELQRMISKLTISDEEKKTLQAQVAQLQKATSRMSPPDLHLLTGAVPSMKLPSYDFADALGVIKFGQDQICSVCAKSYTPGPGEIVGIIPGRCPDCRNRIR